MTLSLQNNTDQINNELDIQAFEKAMEEYQSNPKTYTLDEIEKELDIR